jgi:hypothetical protein
MKLYPLLFVNEGAKTPSESMSQGTVAVWCREGTDNVHTSGLVALLDAEKFLSIMRNRLEEYKEAEEGDDDDKPTEKKNPSPRISIDYYFFSERFQESVKGYVSYSRVKSTLEPLYKVGTSAGVEGYGPLAYQLVMYIASKQGNGWLRSDNSLTSGEESSSGVWNGMYERSTSIYEKKWLADLYPLEQAVSVLSSLSEVNDRVSQDLYGYQGRLSRKSLEDRNGPATKRLPYPKSTSEGVFVNYCYDNDLDPSDYGHFWAYRLRVPNSSTVRDLFELSTDLYQEVEKIREEYNASYDDRNSSSRRSQASSKPRRDPYALVDRTYDQDNRNQDNNDDKPLREITPAQFDKIIENIGSRFFGERYRSHR